MRIPVLIVISLSLVTVIACGGNDPPMIGEILTNKTSVEPRGELAINVIADDPDGDSLTYTSVVSAGEIVGTGSIVIWTAPNTEGSHFIKVIISDGEEEDQESLTVDVVKEDR